MAQCSPIWKDSGAGSTYGCLKNPPRVPIGDEIYDRSYLMAVGRATQGDELKMCLMLNATMRFVSRAPSNVALASGAIQDSTTLRF